MLSKFLKILLATVLYKDEAQYNHKLVIYKITYTICIKSFMRKI